MCDIFWQNCSCCFIRREFNSNTSLMNSSVVGVSLYISMACCNSWSYVILADISASWLIFRTSMFCCNWASWLAAFLFTLALSVSSCCSSYAILSSHSLKKIETSVALSMVVVAYAPINCDNLVNFSAGLEGMSLQTMSIGSFPGGNSGVSTLLPFPLSSYYILVQRAIEHI